MQHQQTQPGLTTASTLHKLLQKYASHFARVVPFAINTYKLITLNFTESNKLLTSEIINDTILFSGYINEAIQNHTYGIGGYNELRILYARSHVFDDANEPRRLHLGVDVWGQAGTPVFAPLDGTVHSFAFNDHFGDYGATIILRHILDSKIFYTLYGHLSLRDLEELQEGMPVQKGALIAHLGLPAENGHWPPHLHFQIIENMNGYKGDYPGVCKFSERERYLANSPDADLILQMMQFAAPEKTFDQG